MASPKRFKRTTPDDIMIAIRDGLVPVLNAFQGREMEIMVGLIEFARALELSYQKRTLDDRNSRVAKALKAANIDLGATADREIHMANQLRLVLVLTGVAQALRSEFDTNHPLHNRVNRKSLARKLWKISTKAFGTTLTAHTEATRWLISQDIATA